MRARRHARSRHGVGLRACIYLLRAALLASGGYGLVAFDWPLLSVSLTVFALTYAGALVHRLFRIRVPLGLELWYVAFLFGSLFLGGHLEFYKDVWWWDILMHFTGLMGIALGFYCIAYAWWRSRRLRLPSPVIATLVFACASTVGMAWEIFEFAADAWVGPYLDFQMQRGNQDTMFDFVFNSLGAAIVAVAGYLHLQKGYAWWFGRIAERFYRDNPRLGK